jgi:hypothetical protein
MGREIHNRRALQVARYDAFSQEITTTKQLAYTERLAYIRINENCSSASLSFKNACGSGPDTSAIAFIIPG